MAAEWTTTRIGSPSVSTKAWILRPFHLLAGVVTHCIVFAALFSADLTDWLSRTAVERLASRPIRSRSAMCSPAQIASHVPSHWNLRKML
jgi:hypothetical protein